MSPSTEPGAVGRNRLIVSTSLAGLMVLEYAWNIRFEVQVIWPQFRKSAKTKIFMVARYVGLTGQILDVWFAKRMASGTPTHPLTCKTWYSFHGMTVQCLLISVELLLVLRACKMYNNNGYVIGLLCVFLGAQCAGMAITVRMVVPILSPSPTCMMVESHPGQIYVGALTIASNLCFLTVILWRYLRSNWPKFLRPYVEIMARDSICTVIVVTGNCLVVIFTPLRTQQPQTIRNIIFPLMVFSFWLVAGRLVLNTERFRQEFQNDHELTDVDLDNLEPLEDSDICPAMPSDPKVAQIALSITVDSEPGVGTEEDIADERIYDWADDASLRSCAPTMSMETVNGGECYGSRK
ncbi:hypothetical protein K503DRAFT_855466 [Rhizopogon vinicolor AM-OR11-026]|uniref:Uncharacterized protein n=1 Tax=Rhizopogon vinicolor AM-OR11-026 TaxID=1314800 RepID=A0A1B7N617_9AGAM|nr:hypothetical protein K503DRAFT_855466 [Rhizopogon vinicolor AM-OR11-026]